MYDFDIFGFDLSLAGISAAVLILARVIFVSRKMNVKCANA